uniref:ATP binding cassette subfamily B member 5 n=1 Tax=Gopherus agassizii TaxID=38772 RepID=A0A452HT68_9SAUR
VKAKPTFLSTVSFAYADWLDIILMIIGLIAAVANGTGLPLIIVVFGEITNSFVMIGQAVNMSSAAEKPPAIFSRFAYYYAGIGFAAVILSTIQVGTFLTSAARQTARIRQKFFFAVLHQEMAWFDTSQIGTLNTQLTDDINTIHEGIGDKICIFVQFFATFLTGIVIEFIYGWKLSLVILSVSPLLAAAFLASFTTKELSAYARAGSVAEEILASIRTVVAFNGQMKALAKYDVNLENARKVGVKKSITTYTSLGFTEFVLFGAYGLAFWYGTKLTVEEKENYDIGRVLIISVFFSVLLGTFSLGQGSPHLESLANARGAAYEVYKVISKHRLIDSSAKEGYRPDKLKGEIEFKNIHFSYPSRPDVKILKGLNLKVQSGKTIALVGSSSCGKSTAIQLLQRFYDPVQGEITLDGRDIRTLNIKWLRERIGLVCQEPILFATTIAENIRWAERVLLILKLRKLPDKFNTIVGERGAQLSGGQKQRIAISRALARNPRILLLDEATSALDTQSESIVQATLDKAKSGRTTIVIAHRLSTIRTADIITGFQNGVVVEQGTHSQLMTQKGVYYSLVLQQEMRCDRALLTKCFRFTGHLSTPDHYLYISLTGSSEKKKKMKEKEEENLPAVPYSRILALNKPEWLHIFFGVIAAAFSGGVYPAFAVIFGKIIGVIEISSYLQQVVLNMTVQPSTYNSTVVFPILSFQGFMFGKSGEVLTKRLRTLSFKALLQQEIGWYDDHKNAIGVLLTRLATDASQVKGICFRLGLLTKTACILLTAIIIAFVYDWRLTLLILACIPFIIAANAIRLSSVAGHASKDQKALEEAGRISTEVIENIRTVASLTSEDTFYERYNASLNSPYSLSLDELKVVLCLVFRAFLSILFGAMNVGQSTSLAPDFGKAKVSAQRIFQLLDRKPLVDSYSEEGTKLSQFDGNIEFRDIHFVYPTRPEAHVLQGLSVKVNKGQMLALVGSSGCGKSTSIQLLERFYDPMAGQVFADGFDTETLHLQWLRSKLGIVSQEPFLFDCSIAENIQYGDNSRVVSQEEVEEAAKAANIHTFIENLPEKYNTQVSDKGAQLSGGQKQRIAIARALVRKPAVLLLDEATSALDTESEKIVQKALDDARKGRTCIIIAHRMTTVQNADVIAVINNGKLVEQGTHSQLLAKEGHYYALVNAQVSH